MANTKKKTSASVDMSDVVADECVKASDIDLKSTTQGAVKIDDSALINVRSNVFGELFYIDHITKERVSWPCCGAVQQLPMGMLRHMKLGAAKFFERQLVLIIGFADENAEKYEVADIYKNLYITQYYQNILDPTNYDEICSWSPDEISEKVSMMPAATRAKLAVALNTYIEKGLMDSLRAIRAFEKALGCELKIPE